MKKYTLLVNGEYNTEIYESNNKRELLKMCIMSDYPAIVINELVKSIVYKNNAQRKIDKVR